MKILVIVLALALVIGCGTTVSVENPVSSPDTECKKYIDIADAIVKRNDALEATEGTQSMARMKRKKQNLIEKQVGARDMNELYSNITMMKQKRIMRHY